MMSPQASCDAVRDIISMSDALLSMMVSRKMIQRRHCRPYCIIGERHQQWELEQAEDLRNLPAALGMKGFCIQRNTPACVEWQFS